MEQRNTWKYIGLAVLAIAAAAMTFFVLSMDGRPLIAPATTYVSR